MKYRIRDLATIYRGSSPRPIQDYLSDTGWPWLKISDFCFGDRVVYKTKQYIKEINNTKLVKKGTLVLTNSASPGIPIFLGKDICLHDGFLYFEEISDKLDKNYLFYWLTYYRQNIVNLANGSVFRNLKKEIVENLEIDLPDLKTQKQIVRILSALDQKIELNNQESENLRKIIKTLYGNTASSIKEKTKLADLAKVSSGKRPTCIEADGEYAVVGARDVMGFTNEYNQEPEVIITGRVGTLGVVKRYPRKIWASDNTLIVDTRYKNYVECYLSSVDFGAYNRGSTQPLITQTDLKNFVLPFDKEKCDSFEDRTASFRNKMFTIDEQNEELIMIRGTLLPKLMSGEINIDKVEI